jgi:hypothetical protein
MKNLRILEKAQHRPYERLSRPYGTEKSKQLHFCNKQKFSEKLIKDKSKK